VQAAAKGEDRPVLHRVGRYEIFDRIASGGMATVHLARLSGAEGFSRVVAVKRMHPQFQLDPEFKAMFVAESRVAARVRHPNVVPILDVLAENDELVIVMDYVHGESAVALARAARQAATHVPVDIACSVLTGLLHGLHAAHTALDEQGRPLGIVHRDVSPHNVLVGVDGVARVLDFGIAKARQGHTTTDPGVVKGKFSYMAPELLHGDPATPRSDVFSAAVVAFELLTGTKLFGGANEQERIRRVLQGDYPHVRSVAAHVPVAMDEVIMRGLALDPAQRYADARSMAIAFERAVPLASPRVVGEWVAGLAAQVLAQRSELIQQIETTTIGVVRRSVAPGPLVSVPAAGMNAAAPATPATTEASGLRMTKRAPVALLAAGVIALGLAALGAALALRPPASPPAPAEPVAPRAASTTVVPVATAAPPPAAPVVTAAPSLPEPDKTPEKPAPAAAASPKGSLATAPLRSHQGASGARPSKRPVKAYLPNEL
jgi:eukaryotic-like serine/threonine-protein kinase